MIFPVFCASWNPLADSQLGDPIVSNTAWHVSHACLDLGRYASVVIYFSPPPTTGLEIRFPATPRQAHPLKKGRGGSEEGMPSTGWVTGFSSCKVGRVGGWNEECCCRCQEIVGEPREVTTLILKDKRVGELVKMTAQVSSPRCPKFSHLNTVSYVTLITASLANSGHRFGRLKMGVDDTRSESCFFAGHGNIDRCFVPPALFW